jgi:hypothetical protein
VSDKSKIPYFDIGIYGFYWINGQLYLKVNPLFLLVPITANVQFGLTPRWETLLFKIAATTFLF